MSSRKISTIRFFILAFAFLGNRHSGIALAQQARTRFTVADEIGIAHFGDPYYGEAEVLLFSPDGNYFAVDTERGRLELNQVEDSCACAGHRIGVLSHQRHPELSTAIRSVAASFSSLGSGSF